MVSKEVLKWSRPVAIDPSEVLALPDEVREIVKGKAGVTPKVFVMDPALTQSFGEFNHEELKGKNWSSIFKGAKGGISSALRKGSFIKASKVAKAKDAVVEYWKSSAGTNMKAKLVAIEDDSVFVFETAEGKTIRASEKQLSPESVARAKSLVSE